VPGIAQPPFGIIPEFIEPQISQGVDGAQALAGLRVLIQ
jgi:hypothetical protein